MIDWNLRATAVPPPHDLSGSLDLLAFRSAREIPGVQQKLAFLPYRAYPEAQGSAPSGYLIDRGEAIGESLEIVILGVREGLAPPTEALVVEPVDLGPARRRWMESSLGEDRSDRMRVEAYCLQKDLRAPAAGTVLRVASEVVQDARRVERRILHAARALRDAGRLHPNTPSRSYYHSVVQWALWARREGYGHRGFQIAFLEHARENFDRAGRAWTRAAEADVRALVDARWGDVRQILCAAETEAKGRAPIPPRRRTGDAALIQTAMKGLVR